MAGRFHTGIRTVVMAYSPHMEVKTRAAMMHSLLTGSRIRVAMATRSLRTGIRRAATVCSLLTEASRQAAVMAGSLLLADSRLTIILTALMPCRRKSRTRGCL